MASAVSASCGYRALGLRSTMLAAPRSNSESSALDRSGSYGYVVSNSFGQPGTPGLKIEFTGWATAEVGGGGLERLTTVRKQMEEVFGLKA